MAAVARDGFETDRPSGGSIGRPVAPPHHPAADHDRGGRGLSWRSRPAGGGPAGGGGAGLAYRGGTHRPLACDGTDLLRPPMGRALSAGLSGTLSGDTPLTRPDR